MHVSMHLFLPGMLDPEETRIVILIDFLNAHVTKLSKQ